MSGRKNNIIQLVAVALVLLGLAFTVYQTLIINRATLKNELLGSFLKWQNVTQKLSCYYNHAEDKAIFSKEISDDYSAIQKEMESVPEELKAEIEVVDSFGLNGLNVAFNNRIEWSYKFHGAYYDDFVKIKSHLNDNELSRAIRNCEHEL